jgi:bacteriocin-like protein
MIMATKTNQSLTDEELNKVNGGVQAGSILKGGAGEFSKFGQRTKENPKSPTTPRKTFL